MMLCSKSHCNHSLRHTHQSSGFTLIELSIGVAILIVAAVVLSRYSSNMTASEKGAESGRQFYEVADELIDTLYASARGLRAAGSCATTNVVINGLSNGSFTLTQVSSVSGPSAAFSAMNGRCAAGQSSSLGSLNGKQVYYGCYRLQPLSNFGELSKMTVYAEVTLNFVNTADETSITCNTFQTTSLRGVRTIVNLLWFDPKANGLWKSMPLSVTRGIP